MSATGSFTTWLERRGRMPLGASILIGAVLLCAAGTVDWMTGPQIALSLLYVVPITWMTCRVGRWAGLGMCLASGGVWLWAELVEHVTYSSAFVPYWNALVRLGLFCVISTLESEVIERKRVEQGLRQTQEELEQRVQQRTAQLQALNASLEKQVADRSAAAEERARQLAASEADLHKQTDILQSILNSMGDGVVVTDAHGGLVHINPAAKRILRSPAENTDILVWLQSCENCLPAASAETPGPGSPLLEVVRGQAADAAEVLLRPAGLPAGVWLSVNSRPLVDRTGTTTGRVIVFSDISARKNLERQIAEISDREQRHLGEDLHDGLCQHLVSVAFAARKLAGKLAEQSLHEAEDATQIAELLGESIAQARAVARGLYLVPREAGGLRSALEEFVMQVRARHRMPCHFVEHVSVPIEGEMVVTNLFRIAQEAVTNAIKHARASRIAVTLSADPEEIRLTIEDDGTGFQPDSQPTHGMGLHLMNYRARMMGAALRIERRSAGGTTVSCSLRREILSEQGPYVERT